MSKVIKEHSVAIKKKIIFVSSITDKSLPYQERLKLIKK